MTNIVRFSRNPASAFGTPFSAIDIEYFSYEFVAGSLRAENTLISEPFQEKIKAEQPQTLLLNVVRRPRHLIASLAVNLESRDVTDLRFSDLATIEDACAVARLLVTKDWAARYSVPRDPFVLDLRGQAHRSGNLPDVLTVDGHIDFTGLSEAKLPTYLRATGTVAIIGCTVASAPRFIEAHVIYVTQSKLEEVAQTIRCTSDFHIVDCSITRPCEMVSVTGNLLVDGCERPVEPPKAMRVGGNLLARERSFARTPKNAIVLGKVAAPDGGKDKAPYALDCLGNVLNAFDPIMFVGSPFSAGDSGDGVDYYGKTGTFVGGAANSTITRAHVLLDDPSLPRTRMIVDNAAIIACPPSGK